MDCLESIELLSDFHAGSLDEGLRVQVHAHLIDCPPCHDVFRDLESIIALAHLLQAEETGILYPDEEVVWQRMNLSARAVH